MSGAVIVVTGAAKRIGAAISRHLHQQGYRLVLHYHRSAAEAEQLARELNAKRANSVSLVCQDLTQLAQLEGLVAKLIGCYGRVDGLVNNASSFYATPLASSTPAQWHDLFSTNAAAPYFLCQGLAPQLIKHQGAIVNMVDIHAEKGLSQHLIYSMAKNALITLTRGLACELAPQVRVNAIAPGAILWPEQPLTATQKKHILASIPMARLGDPQDIAQTVEFLLQGPRYLTGEIITLDGGRSIQGLPDA
ncbi:pteridine reductase [Oceanisphaera avium]|uniref:Pteridine reductase n=1 Tax=Oceanisphaera avium TaxID=1903694 RepID=A0A1Y0CVP4_9GAMM|nr:pteridine reductase [Oceanisphaera avium]ART79288.1 pteridine reductase [Oceanisphaera avium]